MPNVTITLAQEDPELWAGIEQAKRAAALEPDLNEWAGHYACDIQILLVYIARLEADLNLPRK